MGVPRFYRWLSERYPFCNQQVTKHTKQQYDCLYLDMNGIIHNCTNGGEKDEDAMLFEDRIPDMEHMMLAIFKYIEKLVIIVRPQKLLYMALDGVAPRAKMNQQRQRRFRSAKDAEAQLAEQREKGTVKKGVYFDRNAITPGTEFMQNLSENLTYFIRKKINEDALWQQFKVIFSGAECPGEGEHKLMLYMRNMKMQPGYEPNLRHCIYGLDADLIFLSLVSHEPHLSLLREEVVFGGTLHSVKFPRKILKKLDDFQFLHISLLRQYLDIEYSSLKAHLSFEYDLERIIDDWLFLAMLIGNDFLPHLPTLDISEGGLDTLFQIYKETLPMLTSYITDCGKVDLGSFELILQKLGALEEDVFRMRIAENAKKNKGRHYRNNIVNELESYEDFVTDDPSFLLAGHQQSGKDMQKHANHSYKQRYYQQKFPEFFGETCTESLSLDLNSLSAHSHSSFNDDDDMSYTSDDSASTRNAPFHDIELSHSSFEPSPIPPPMPAPLPVGTDGQPLLPEQHIQLLVKNYLEGLLWTVSYYYLGCISWKWFFAYRHAPLASDMRNLSLFDIKFDLGLPFHPLEQLLGVLPPQSRTLLPTDYGHLMIDDSSPIQHFYPADFEIDMDGKKASWEGIALIPFIDEKLLLQAVNADHIRLNVNETKRNARFGTEFLFIYDPTNHDTVFPHNLPSLPTIKEAHSRVEVFHLPFIPFRQPDAAHLNDVLQRAREAAIVAGGAQYNPSLNGPFVPRPPVGLIFPSPGFPNLQSLSVHGELLKLGVNVFGAVSKKDSLVLSVSSFGPSSPDAVQHMLNKLVWIDWPFQREALVTSVSTRDVHYTLDGFLNQDKAGRAIFEEEASSLTKKLLQSRGLRINAVVALVYARPLLYMKRMRDGSVKKVFDDQKVVVPYQLVLHNVSNPDSRFIERPPITLGEAFPLYSQIVYIGPKYYGSIGTVVAHHEANQSVDVTLVVLPPAEAFGVDVMQKSSLQYYPSHMIAKHLGISPLVVSKIFSSVLVYPGKVDIGLKLKFSKQNLQVPDYALRTDAWKNTSSEFAAQSKMQYEPSAGQWEYSEKALVLLVEYMRRFPKLFEVLNAAPTEPLNATSFADKPGKDGAIEAIENISNWLNSIGINGLTLVPCSSKVMPERGISKIEIIGSRLNEQLRRLNKPIVMLYDVQMYHLYKPTPQIAWSPSDGMLPRLGDRILSLRSDEGAPLGLRGTVVAIHPDRATGRCVEIVFDECFASGSTLNGKCSPQRGQILGVSHFLNLSQPVVLTPKLISDERKQHVANINQSYTKGLADRVPAKDWKHFGYPDHSTVNGNDKAIVLRHSVAIPTVVTQKADADLLIRKAALSKPPVNGTDDSANNAQMQSAASTVPLPVSRSVDIAKRLRTMLKIGDQAADGSTAVQNQQSAQQMTPAQATVLPTYTPQSDSAVLLKGMVNATYENMHHSQPSNLSAAVSLSSSALLSPMTPLNSVSHAQYASYHTEDLLQLKLLRAKARRAAAHKGALPQIIVQQGKSIDHMER